LYGTFECRTVDTLLAFGSNGRVYSVPVSLLPGGRGDGQPITSLIELEAGTQLLYYFAGPVSASLLLSGSAGLRLCCLGGGMVSKYKAGKAFVTVNEGETLCAPSVVLCDSGSCSHGLCSHACGLCVHTGAHPDL
jgi:topoisomerase-4 subunit A